MYKKLKTSHTIMTIINKLLLQLISMCMLLLITDTFARKEAGKV